MKLDESYKLTLNEYPDIVNTSQMCEMLKVGKSAGYRIIKQGKIKYFKIGNSYRIPKICVLSYMGVLDEKDDDRIV